MVEQKALLKLVQSLIERESTEQREKKTGGIKIIMLGFKWEQTSKMVDFWIEPHHKNVPTNPKILINNNYNCTMVPAFDSFFICIGRHSMKVSVFFSTSKKRELVSLLAFIPPSVVSFVGLCPYCQGHWTIVATSMTQPYWSALLLHSHTLLFDHFSRRTKIGVCFRIMQ